MWDRSCGGETVPSSGFRDQTSGEERVELIDDSGGSVHRFSLDGGQLRVVAAVERENGHDATLPRLPSRRFVRLGDGGRVVGVIQRCLDVGEPHRVQS